MHPSQVTIAIVSVNRPGEYVHRTLESLRFSMESLSQPPVIHLVVGSNDGSYLKRYESDPDLSIHWMSDDLWRTVADWGVHRRFCVNYWRCLTLPLDDSIGLCICEDDVVVRPGFLEKLCLTIAEMERHGLTDYVLAAYAAYNFESNPSLYRGELYCSYFAPSFYGTQCVYYPKAVAHRVGAYLKKRGVDQAGPPGDLIINDYCKEHHNLYACTRSLAQHVGRLSTGLGTHHQSPTFDLEFRRLPKW